MSKIRIGIIGGSGLYQMDELADVREQVIDTPYGRPSDVIVTGTLDGTAVAFVARHGRGHGLIPSEVPYRANLYALKTLGVQYVLAVSAVGSLQETIRPLDLVLPDQFIDFTRQRAGTFFGDGAVAHVSLAQPVCPALSALLADAIDDAGLGAVRVHRGGTYVCIEGPAFSTRAESLWYRSLPAQVIGMTNMPEARLAREAQMAYATLALVTDYDAWHPREAAVTADVAIANLMHNAANARRVVVQAVRRLAATWPDSIAHTALANGLITPPDSMAPAVRARLAALLPS